MTASGTVAALVWCPFPDHDSAAQVAERLLGERLIACANILGNVTSVFAWDGGTQRGTEVGVLFKTTAQALDALVERLGALHPYDTPAILGWRCDGAHPATLAWLDAAIARTPNAPD